MQDFFNYEYLGTLAGATAATTLIVQFLKKLPVIKKLRTRWLVLIVATSLIIAVALITGQFRIYNLLLYIINSLFVTTLSIGSWHTVTKNSKSDKKNT